MAATLNAARREQRAQHELKNNLKLNRSEVCFSDLEQWREATAEKITEPIHHRTVNSSTWKDKTELYHQKNKLERERETQTPF